MTATLIVGLYSSACRPNFSNQNVREETFEAVHMLQDPQAWRDEWGTEGRRGWAKKSF